MLSRERVLDDLRNIALVLSVGLNVVDQHRDTFETTTDQEHLRQFEAAVTEVRTLAGQLEKELSYLEYLVARPPK